MAADTELAAMLSESFGREPEFAKGVGPERGFPDLM